MPAIAAAVAIAATLLAGATTATVYTMDQVFLIEVGADYATSKIMNEYYNLCAQIAKFPRGKVPGGLRERAIAKWNYINSIRNKRGQKPIKACHI